MLGFQHARVGTKKVITAILFLLILHLWDLDKSEK